METLVDRMPDPGTLDRYAALASLAGEYLSGRITDAEYVDAAVILGRISRDQAICNVMAFDDASVGKL
jgi:hypothetical protein